MLLAYLHILMTLLHNFILCTYL